MQRIPTLVLTSMGVVALMLLASCAAEQAPPAPPVAPPVAASPAAAPEAPAPARPANEPAAPPMGAPAGMEGALPIDPSQLADLKAALDEVLSLASDMQHASTQGRARIIKKQLKAFMDQGEAVQAVPFRENLDRIVEILAESDGDELSEDQKGQLRQEVQAIQSELGIDTSGTSSSDSGGPMIPPPGPGPGPRPPGPGPRPPGPP